jgi:hypothetical protein
MPVAPLKKHICLGRLLYRPEQRAFIPIYRVFETALILQALERFVDGGVDLQELVQLAGEWETGISPILQNGMKYG